MAGDKIGSGGWRGIHGPHGFIHFPGEACGIGYEAWEKQAIAAIALGMPDAQGYGIAQAKVAAPMNATANRRMQPGEMIAQMPNTPGKMFSRTEILTSLKAIMASKGGIAEAITAFENLE